MVGSMKFQFVCYKLCAHMFSANSHFILVVRYLSPVMAAHTTGAEVVTRLSITPCAWCVCT